MKLHSLLELIATSTDDMWSVLTPPSEEIDPAHSTRVHTSKAVYREDVSLEVAWGVPEFGPEPIRGFWASWSTFPNPEVHSFFAEIFFGGRVVARRKLVYADGLRVVLPAPLPELSGPAPAKPDRWTIRASELPIAELITSFTGISTTPWDSDLKASGLVVVDE